MVYLVPAPGSCIVRVICRPDQAVAMFIGATVTASVGIVCVFAPNLGLFMALAAWDTEWG